jgi:hypothetical protein
MAQVICNDGTIDVDNGEVLPCVNHGGISGQTGGVKAAPTDATNSDACVTGTTWNQSTQKCESIAPSDKDLTSTQKWGLVVGLTLVAYFILYKAGSLK